MSRIGLLDYGMGNLHSVQRAFERLGATVVPIDKAEEITLAETGQAEPLDAVVLPGVGAFDPAMEQLEHSGLIPAIRHWCAAGRPLLGICLGLQLLFEASDEGQRAGLGLIPGTVRALPRLPGHPIPHMGWAPLLPAHPSPLLPEGLENQWVYFVHSYAAEPSDPTCITARVDFGGVEATAALWQEPLAACQFHPEKSGPVGEAMLGRWLRWLEQRQS
ncbi:MAG: imidazole glycerol phosphate synthase subunit HisH [Prochlorococcaceae cyanobacterium]|jgi:glutamine amidotransferase